MAYLYCQQLEIMMEKIAIQQPKLVNCSSPLLLQDNARPRTSRKTVAKLDELRLEFLRRSPYSRDLALRDYHFFRYANNFFQGKKNQFQWGSPNCLLRFY
ncbi:Histone-lysine N-methyltransferase SETMAR [Eumeta japonica]|uniref:Histone-lysine N-methyltransferase SETMAR n=1 Tax=Eumeta variegata TaxID=151549 RepID=A0A4C2ABK6_EUMVA|nr:Histone-lysine N-methyltransferase SETMAR [Eumeta japonica]